MHDSFCVQRHILRCFRLPDLDEKPRHPSKYCSPRKQMPSLCAVHSNNSSRQRPACLGTSGSFHAYTHQEISSLELCRVRCVETPGCTAVDFGALGCRVWTEDVIQTEDRKGSTCLRYGSMFSNASAFKPVNGGMDRACRGMNASDNSDSYYDLLWSWPENSSISACQDRCASALGCFYMLLPCVVCMLKHAEAAF